MTSRDIGRAISFEGAVEYRKAGPRVSSGSASCDVDFADHAGPQNAEGRRVLVTGVVEEWHDLPVFVQDPTNSVLKAGIPVPPGTDLYAASARLVITKATWRWAP